MQEILCLNITTPKWVSSVQETLTNLLPLFSSILYTIHVNRKKNFKKIPSWFNNKSKDSHEYVSFSEFTLLFMFFETNNNIVLEVLYVSYCRYILDKIEVFLYINK